MLLIFFLFSENKNNELLLAFYYCLMEFKIKCLPNEEVLVNKLLDIAGCYLDGVTYKEEFASVIVPILIKIISFDKTYTIKMYLSRLALLIIQTGKDKEEFDNIRWSNFDSFKNSTWCEN